MKPSGLGFDPQSLGIWVGGDLAGVTMYTNKKGRKVVYLQAPPHKPLTYWQILQRLRFKTAMAAWMELDPAERQHFNLACDLASLPFTGVNLYLRCALKPTGYDLDALIRQTGVFLLTPPYIP